MCLSNSLPEAGAIIMNQRRGIHESHAISRQIQLSGKLAGESSDGE